MRTTLLLVLLAGPAFAQAPLDGRSVYQSTKPRIGIEETPGEAMPPPPRPDVEQAIEELLKAVRELRTEVDKLKPKPAPKPKKDPVAAAKAEANRIVDNIRPAQGVPAPSRPFVVWTYTIPHTSVPAAGFSLQTGATPGWYAGGCPTAPTVMYAPGAGRAGGTGSG